MNKNASPRKFLRQLFETIRYIGGINFLHTTAFERIHKQMKSAWRHCWQNISPVTEELVISDNRLTLRHKTMLDSKDNTTSTCSATRDAS